MASRYTIPKSLAAAGHGEQVASVIKLVQQIVLHVTRHEDPRLHGFRQRLCDGLQMGAIAAIACQDELCIREFRGDFRKSFEQRLLSLVALGGFHAPHVQHDSVSRGCMLPSIALQADV